MTIQEYFRENPDMLKKLKKCESEDEFTLEAEKYGLKIGTNKVSEVYDFVHNFIEDEEMDNDSLKTVSGGTSGLFANTLDIGGKKMTLIN